MNPLDVETALVASLAGSFSGQTLYTGTGYQELTPESLNIILSCADLKHSVGGLYRASCTARLVAPALLGASSLSSLTSALNTLRSALSAGLSASWPTASGTPGYGGIWIEETVTSQEEHGWVAEVKFLLGVNLT